MLSFLELIYLQAEMCADYVNVDVVKSIAGLLKFLR
jgi:hypothetical protein